MVGWKTPPDHPVYTAASRATIDERAGTVSSVTTTEASRLSVPVLNRQGDSVGTVQVDPTEFGGKINKQLLHDVVLMHLANQRAGTHSTLRRGEVAGSTKKLFRQKGTGNARVGTRRTNKRRGGGTAKGPKPRDYEYHLPKKAVRAATRMAILSKFQDNEALIIDDFTLDEIGTKQVMTVLKALKLKGITCLVGTADYDTNLYLSGRNIPELEVLPASQFNTYTVLRQKRLVLTKGALEFLRAGTKTEVIPPAPAPPPAASAPAQA
jgi:large subunit ribosomal protein L4